MGFYSYLTCDTKESIANVHSVRECRPVYLLQPGGKEPIFEPEYDGYGEFGGVQSCTWLARQNAESLGLDLTGLTEDEVHLMGIGLSVGSLFKDTESDEYWFVFHNYSQLIPEANYFQGTFDVPIDEKDGRSANELVESGVFERIDIKDYLEIPYPLKFSFDKDAVYEDHEASEDCPDQGFFYEEGD